MSNPRFPSAPAPFVTRHEVAAHLKTAKWQSDALDVLVDVDELGRTPPQCLVIGNQHVALKLRPLHEPPGEVTLVPAAEDALRRVYGTGIHPQELHFRGVDGHLAEGPTGVIATLVGGEIKIEHHSDALKREPATEVKFLLRGAPPPLGVVHSSGSHLDGHIEVETLHSLLETPAELPWSIALEPSYRIAERSDDHQKRVLRWALVLRRTNGQVGTITPELIDEAKQLADDFLLVWSFAARKRLAWHSYSFPTVDGYVEVHRAARTSNDGEVHREDSPLALQEHRAFVCKGVVALRTARSGGSDLLLPLAMAISANERLYLEQRFATVFMAVEKLKDQHARVEGLDLVLAKKDFEKVRRNLSDALTTLKDQLGDEKLKAMKDKLLELNRPPVTSVLQSLFDKHRVEWRDLCERRLRSASD